MLPTGSGGEHEGWLGCSGSIPGLCSCAVNDVAAPLVHDHCQPLTITRKALFGSDHHCPRESQPNLPVTLDSEDQAHHFPGLSMWPRQDFTASSVKFWVFSAESNHFPLILFLLPLLCQICVTSFSNSLFFKKNIYSGFCFLGWTLANTGTPESKLPRFNIYPMLLTSFL